MVNMCKWCNSLASWIVYGVASPGVHSGQVLGMRKQMEEVVLHLLYGFLPADEIQGVISVYICQCYNLGCKEGLVVRIT